MTAMINRRYTTCHDEDAVPELIVDDEDSISSASRTTVNIRRPILPPVERNCWDDEPTKVERDPVWARPGYELRFQRRQEQLAALYLKLLEDAFNHGTQWDTNRCLRRDRIIFVLRRRIGR